MRHFSVKPLFAILVVLGGLSSTFAKEMAVDFAYRPHLWRTAIAHPTIPTRRSLRRRGDGVSLGPSRFRFRHVGPCGGRWRREDHKSKDDFAACSHRANAFEADKLSIVEEAFAAEKQTPRRRPSRSRPLASACLGNNRDTTQLGQAAGRRHPENRPDCGGTAQAVQNQSSAAGRIGGRGCGPLRGLA